MEELRLRPVQAQEQAPPEQATAPTPISTTTTITMEEHRPVQAQEPAQEQARTITTIIITTTTITTMDRYPLKNIRM